MRILYTLATLIGTTAAIAISPVHSLESTAGSKDVLVDESGITARTNAAIADITSKLNALLACNRNNQLYAPDAADADANGCRNLTAGEPIDVSRIMLESGSTNAQRLGRRVRANDQSITQLCIEEGYSGVSSYSGKQYNSPGDNKIAIWDGTKWYTTSAKKGKHLNGSAACYKFSIRPE